MLKPPVSKIKKMKLCVPQPSASDFGRAKILLLSVMLTGCGATLPVIEPSVSPCPAIPSAPELTTPLPSKPYWGTAQLSLAEWRDLLKATLTTSKP